MSPLLNKNMPEGEGAALLPEVRTKLLELGFTDNVEPYEPDLAMQALMRAAEDVCRSLADRMSRRDFWDGGDDIDYVEAAGDLISTLTANISSHCDDSGCATFLNTIAKHSDPDNEDETELQMMMSTAGCGGFHSPILDEIEGITAK